MNDDKRKVAKIALVFIILFLIFLNDGFKIFTLNWKKVDGKIITSEVIEYPINTKYRGTRVAYYSDVKVEFMINETLLVKEMYIDKKLKPGDNITVRYNPKNIDQITSSEINFQFYFIMLSFIIVLSIGSVFFTIVKDRII